MRPDLLTDAELDRLKAEYPEFRPGHCPTCDGAEFYLYRGTKHSCDCRRQRDLQMRYLYAGLGDPYQRLDWDDLTIPVPPEVTDYLAHAEAHVRTGMGLLLWGPLGVGKTMMGSLVLKELIKMDYDCYATLFSATIEQFTAGWNSDEAKRRFADRFMRSRVLFLDDLGKELRRSTQLQVTTFDYILRTRAMNNRATIITTNMSPRELQLGYGSPILSLLVEKSIEVPMTGHTFRPQSHDRTMAENLSGERRPIF